MTVFFDIELVVVGSKISEKMSRQWSEIKGVKVRGFVENIDDAYADCAAVIVPILTGGGTCVKLIEALAHGKKVFSTAFGARGLSEQQLSEAKVSIFEDACGFVNELKDFFELDVDALRTIEENAQKLVRREYSVTFFEKQVRELLGD